MMAWQKPVVDRKEQDVRQQTAKGVLNAEDMNRIEQNAQLLSQLFGARYTARQWADGDFLYQRDLAAVPPMVTALRELYKQHTKGFLPACVPAAPALPLNHWSGWNQVERVQYELHRLHTQNLEEKIYTGESSMAGQEVGVL